MKKSYPNYSITTTKDLEKNLTNKEKEVLEDFLRFCGTTASSERVNRKIKPLMLQYKDIMGNLLDWKEKDIQNFLILLKNSDKAEWTKNDIKKTMKRFIRFYYKNEEFLKMIKCKSDGFNYEKINENTLINLDDFEKILRSCNTLKQKAILSLIFETGCRPQELRMLKWNNLKIEDDEGTVTFYSGKTGKSRTIPIKDSIIHLKRWKEEFEYPNVNLNDFIFPNDRNRDKSLSNGALPVMFKRLSRKAGLNKNIFPYLCRHSRLTLINQKMPSHLACKFAGHNLKQSQTYVHLSSEDLKREMQKIWKVKEISNERKHELELKMELIQKQMVLMSKGLEIFMNKMKENPNYEDRKHELTDEEREIFQQMQNNLKVD